MSAAADRPKIDVEVTLRCDLTSELGELEPAAWSVGPHDDSIWLLLDERARNLAFATYEQPGWATFAKTRADATYSSRVIVHNGRTGRSVELAGQDLTFPELQPLGSEILLVGTRCSYEDGVVRDNAQIYGWDGHLRRTFLLGDGIEKVQADIDGDVWVSYFDEGVFGNFGWGLPGGPEPFGSAGLLRVDRYGRLQWSYDPPDGIGSIDDCYGLNVASDATWAHYYSDYPLVRIGSGDEIAIWKTNVTDESAFAVTDERVLFFDRYWRLKSEATLCELGDGILRSNRQVELVRPGGGPLERPDSVIGRGPLLHLFEGPHWYTVDLRELPA